MWFGPVGVAFALLAGVIAYFYRRDIMKRADELKALHEKRDAHDARIATALEKVAQTNETVAGAISTSNERVAGALNMLGEQLRYDRDRRGKR
jgi:hypothetical protein